MLTKVSVWFDVLAISGLVSPETIQWPAQDLEVALFGAWPAHDQLLYENHHLSQIWESILHQHIVKLLFFDIFFVILKQKSDTFTKHIFTQWLYDYTDSKSLFDD